MEKYPTYIMTFICCICNKRLATKQRLQYHQNNLVCIKQDKRCRFCDKTLTSRRNYRQHKCRIKEDEIFTFRVFMPHLSEGDIGNILDERRHLLKTMKDFDSFMPWYNQPYWRTICESCGCIRKSKEHYTNCGVKCIFCGKTEEHLCKNKEKSMEDLRFIKPEATEEDLINLIKRKRVINLFVPGFEVRTKKSWFSRHYWDGKCSDCGFIRSEEHLDKCLIPQYI